MQKLIPFVLFALCLTGSARAQTPTTPVRDEGVFTRESRTIVNDNFKLIDKRTQGVDCSSGTCLFTGAVNVSGGVQAPNIPLANHTRLSLPAQLNVRSVMASPPTTTFTTSHTISSPLLWPSVTFNTTDYSVSGDAFAYSRAGGQVIKGATYPNYLYTTFTNVNYGGGSLLSNVYGVSFLHYGSAVELAIKGSAGFVMVKVNDQYISLTPQTVPNDGSPYYLYIPFGSSALRRIDVLGYNSAWGGVYAAATDTITPAPIRGPRVIVLGDSFTEGTGATATTSAYVQQFADAMGWDDVWPSGVGSTGYLAVNGAKLKFRDRLATDVYPFNPDIVMFAAGINDSTGFTAAQVQAEALADFQAVRANLPNALIIVLSPFWRGSVSGFGNLLTYRDAIKTSALATGATYLDVLELPLNGITPAVATLAASASASATTISITAGAMLPIGGTIAFANGERYQVKGVSGGGPYTITLDAGLATAHASGQTVTQVGNCLWTGSGKVGSLTGYGNSDVLVSSDGTHPTDAGHAVLGNVIARLLIGALR